MRRLGTSVKVCGLLYIYIFLMFLKEVTSAHQSCIYLMKNREKNIIILMCFKI